MEINESRMKTNINLLDPLLNILDSDVVITLGIFEGEPNVMVTYVGGDQTVTLPDGRKAKVEGSREVVIHGDETFLPLQLKLLTEEIVANAVAKVEAYRNA